ncbi:MAG: YncE family protein, partial [Bacteroidetes bacterium]
FDNNILVIDTETDQWVETLEVLIQPQSMVLDAQQNLWVLSDGGYQGNPFGQEQPGLLRINTTTLEVDTIHRFNIDDSPSSLGINKTKDTLWFINRHVYRYAIESGNEPERIIESPYPSHTSGGYRSLGIDPVSSEIYVGDAIDLVQPGLVYRFSPKANPIDTFRVGIIPGGFAFKNELP